MAFLCAGCSPVAAVSSPMTPAGPAHIDGDHSTFRMRWYVNDIRQIGSRYVTRKMHQL
jgi:hypothetical protein